MSVVSATAVQTLIFVPFLRSLPKVGVHLGQTIVYLHGLGDHATQVAELIDILWVLLFFCCGLVETSVFFRLA